MDEIIPSNVVDESSLRTEIEELKLEIFQKDQRLKFRDDQIKNLRKEINDLILEMLVKTVNSPKGTAAEAKLTEKIVAGKTGTAEDSSGGEDHAWFVCFSPYEASEIVIVAFAQNTPGGGSVHAVPMAQDILKAWHERSF